MLVSSSAGMGTFYKACSLRLVRLGSVRHVGCVTWSSLVRLLRACCFPYPPPPHHTTTTNKQHTKTELLDFSRPADGGNGREAGIQRQIGLCFTALLEHPMCRAFALFHRSDPPGLGIPTLKPGRPRRAMQVAPMFVRLSARHRLFGTKCHSWHGFGRESAQLASRRATEPTPGVPRHAGLSAVQRSVEPESAAYGVLETGSLTPASRPCRPSSVGGCPLDLTLGSDRGQPCGVYWRPIWGSFWGGERGSS